MSRGPLQPTREQILETLERIERSKGFRRSLRMTRFLRFVVESALDGRLDDLREIVIGMEVFDRGDTFDPAEDNIVRVDAARLRSKLADYYANAGARERVRITVPKGGYVPEFALSTARDASSAGPLCERGFRHLRRRNVAEIAKATSVFEAAALEDPDCAAAFEGLASCRLALAEMGLGPAASLLGKAAEEARRALKLDAVSAQAMLTLATVELLQFQAEAAEERIRRILRIAPESAPARTLLGRLQGMRRNEAEALEEHERAVGLDPNDERARLALGWELCMQGELEEALQQAHAASYFEPGLHEPHVLAAAAYCAQDECEQARAELEQARLRAPEDPWSVALSVYAAPADSEQAAGDLARLLARAERDQASRVCVAVARLGVGEDASVDLETALVACDPQLERLRLPLFGEWRARKLPWQ
ncbi:MAG: hypothetical protein KDC27_03710 [Acidobacteria bacterium]|nr:hypothetical protein [Acidobacteriota bacterium]